MAGTTTWKAVWKKGVTWGTAIAAVALDAIKISSESMPPGIPERIKDENVGESMTGGVYQGNFSVGGSINVPVRYLGIERILALFMGSDVVVQTVGETIVWDHNMVFQPSNTGQFGTLLLDKGLGAVASRLWEYPSCKPVSIELSFNDGKTEIAFELIADRCERTVASQINDITEVNAATYPTTGLLTIFNQMRFYMTTLTGAEGNLDGADELLVTDLKFMANRNLSGVHQTGANAGVVDEPETDGLPEATLEITFANYTAALDDLIKDTQTRQTASLPKIYKASAIWTGPSIPSSVIPTNYQFRLDIGAMTIEDGPVNASGPGAKVPVTLTFRVQTPQVVPNGTDWSWAAVGANPFRFKTVNTSNVDAA